MQTATPDPDLGPSPVIRAYRPADHDAVYDVCVRTGAGGQDARGLYTSDDLIPDIYAGPYLAIEPDLAFVLDNGRRAVGYVLGTADTTAFVVACQERWLPRVLPRYQKSQQSDDPAEQRQLFALAHPERMLKPELAAHPAHLHINLLPDYQGAGHGRSLIDKFLRSAAEVGARSAHLTVRTTNTSALGFYYRLGWQNVPVTDPGPWTFLARPTS